RLVFHSCHSRHRDTTPPPRTMSIPISSALTSAVPAAAAALLVDPSPQSGLRRIPWRRSPLRPIVVGAVAAAVALTVVTGAAWAAPVRADRFTVGTPRADTSADFHWTGHVDAQRWVRVRNLSGWIRVERATGSDVEIVGHKKWRHGDPDRVRITM